MKYEQQIMNKNELILIKLRELYPDVKCSLNHSSAWQLLLATILSAQCTDKRVNVVTNSLFQEYPKVKDINELPIDILILKIKSTGFYNNKSKNIKQTAKIIVEDFDSEVPGNMDDLVSLPGVARKTANVVLANWFHIHKGIAVDTHVKRLSNRIGFSKEKSPQKIEKRLMKIFKNKDWGDISLLLIQHGRDVCKSRKPECEKCVLRDYCPSANYKGQKIW